MKFEFRIETLSRREIRAKVTTASQFRLSIERRWLLPAQIEATTPPTDSTQCTVRREIEERQKSGERERERQVREKKVK